MHNLSPITPFSFVIEICTPVHIGCNEVYEPTGFTVNETQSCLTAFEPLSFIRKLNAKDLTTFSCICQTGQVKSIQELYKFMRNRPISGHAIPISNGFIQHYNDVLNKAPNEFIKQLNQFSIYRTAFCTHDQRAYIPGSSIKGAIRTAFLNHLAKNQPTQIKCWNKNDSKELEAKLFGLNSSKNLFSDDPFQCLKVSDFMPIGHIQHKIMYAVNIKKKQSKPDRGLYQILEVIQPGARFIGTISMDTFKIKTLHQEKRYNLEMNAILDKCKQFYNYELRNEKQTCDHMHLTYPIDYQGTDTPLRLGRHSGAECMTINGYRQIKIIKLNKIRDHATTVWAAANQKWVTPPIFPFGWVKLIPADPLTQKQCHDIETTYLTDVQQQLEQSQKELKQSAQQEEEQNQQQRLQEQKRIKEEHANAQLQAKLNQMSPEQRTIYEIQHDLLKEDQVNAVANRINSFSHDYKAELAHALKTYYQQNNIWQVLSRSKNKKLKMRKKTIEALIAQGGPA